MRVQEIASASCAKMTEEKNLNGSSKLPSGSKKPFGINSDELKNAASLEVDRSCSIAGGRLKFFKDGKFILELHHRKEGDRQSWVSVPKKTYWPPPGAAGTPRQESSTSLSVSDDNSSIQSSPWQRDHCWKQTIPRIGISRELTFFMQPLKGVKEIRKLQCFINILRKKRRSPYDKQDITLIKDLKYENIKNRKQIKRLKLKDLVQSLWERITGPGSESVASGICGASSVSVQSYLRTANTSTASRLDPSIISPRKRILRELERVSLEDQTNSKRQRGRTAPASAFAHNNNNGNSNVNCTVTCQTLQPAIALPSPVVPSPPRSTPKSNITNYSITSLLGSTRDEEQKISPHEGESSFLRTLLKSPSRPSTPEPISKNITKLNSSRKSSPTYYHSPSPESQHSGIRTPLVPPPHLGPYLSPHLLYQSPYLPIHHNSPTFNPQNYYNGLSTIPYRGSGNTPPLWFPFPLSSLPRSPLCSGLTAPLAPYNWSPINHPPLDDFKKEDNSSDVPLNLSKHAG